jgi:SAM-dependent methyltransferase
MPELDMTTAPLGCPCQGAYLSAVFTYDAPPEGETRFKSPSAQPYVREIQRCAACGHFVSIHAMDIDDVYTSDYMTSTYGDDGIRQAYERIKGLVPARSDNVGRVERVVEFSGNYLQDSVRGRSSSILDVGSGICVFLDGMKAAGWDCTALDPDPRCTRHAKEVVGVHAVCADFMEVEGLARYDAISFNKVLEHVQDPVAMLSRALRFLNPHGFVYVELPDGEAAAGDGPGREEFFIEHWHVFSAASVALLAERSSARVVDLERLREPSGKYTLRAFVAPV